MMMKKQIKKMIGGVLVAGVMITGLATGLTVYAASTDTGAAAAAVDTDYSLEEMLVYAIEDEYMAQAEYNVIMDTYGIQKPFSNIIKAEATHISLLEPVLEKYGVAVPEKDWENLVTVPESLDDSYNTGVEAEIKNIEMYESFLKENIPDDVSTVFKTLMSASEKHLAAFQRQADGVDGINDNNAGNCTGDGTGTRRRSNSTASKTGNGKSTNKVGSSLGGNGEGNRNTSQNNCTAE